MKIASLALAALLGAASTPAIAATLFFDFGGTATTGGVYNDVAPSVASVVSDAIDSTGAPTGITVVATGFNELGPNTGGTTAPTGAAAIFDPQATRDSFFGHSSNFNAGGARTPGIVTLAGLDPSGLTSYDFTFFASRLGGTQNRETRYSVAGANSGVALLDAANNVSNVAVVGGIIPSSAGVIAVTVNAGPANNTGADLFFYLGAMRVVSTAVPEPGCGALLLACVSGLACVRVRVRR